MFDSVVDDFISIFSVKPAKDVLKIQSPRNKSLPPKKITPKDRFEQLTFEIEQPVINMDRIRELAFDGLPDGHLRSVYWKLLLGYLPVEHAKWESELAKNRSKYNELLKDMPIDPHRCDHTVNEISSITEANDHPLDTSNNSQWNKFFKVHEIIQEIEKDVHRTFPHLHFFQIGQLEDTDFGKVLNNQHYQALRNILFIWAKLNPSVAYVQGMNEILGPLYYVFATDTDPDFQTNAEADAYFCFNLLMREIGNNFCKSMDFTPFGINAKIEILCWKLREKDPELWINFKTKNLNAQYYSFRWLTLLLSQEFELPDVLIVWDTLLSDKNRFSHLINICVSMLIDIREELMKGDFADNLKMLQTYPTGDIVHILNLAKKIANPSFQITPKNLGSMFDLFMDDMMGR